MVLHKHRTMIAQLAHSAEKWTLSWGNPILKKLRFSSNFFPNECVFFQIIYFFSLLTYWFQMSYALLPARIMWRQNPCSCPIPPPCWERGDPPHLHTSPSVVMHTRMNVHGFGFMLKCMRQRVWFTHMCSCACSRATHPPHLYIYCNRTSLPSFAIRCYGNKGTDWSGCSSQSETQRKRGEDVRL